jgi:hypothetical protein
MAAAWLRAERALSNLGMRSGGSPSPVTPKAYGRTPLQRLDPLKRKSPRTCALFGGHVRPFEVELGTYQTYDEGVTVDQLAEMLIYSPPFWT